MERSNPQSQTAPKGSPFTGILWGLLIVLLLNGLIFPSFSGGRIVETDYGTFISKVDSGLVRDVVIKNGEIYFTSSGAGDARRPTVPGRSTTPGWSIGCCRPKARTPTGGSRSTGSSRARTRRCSTSFSCGCCPGWPST